MLIKIGGRNFEFDDTSDLTERNKAVEVFLKQVLTFDDLQLTVSDYFKETWDKQATRVALDRIGTYLSKMPDQNGQEDKEVLSNSKIIEMEKGTRRTTKNGKTTYESSYVNFSNLSLTDKVSLGLDTDNDYI